MDVDGQVGGAQRVGVLVFDPLFHPCGSARKNWIASARVAQLRSRDRTSRRAHQAEPCTQPRSELRQRAPVDNRDEPDPALSVVVMTRAAWRMSGYRVEDLLGAGSSGEVWRGRVVATGAPVALKRCWLSDPTQRAAALSEAAMLSALDHPHLMKLHELRHVGDDAIVLVLDLASGGSLAALLARRGRLTLGETSRPSHRLPQPWPTPSTTGRAR